MTPAVDISALRRRLAAPGRPDEGMRGSAADAARRGVVEAPELCAALAAALRTEPEEAAAAVRSGRALGSGVENPGFHQGLTQFIAIYNPL